MLLTDGNNEPAVPRPLDPEQAAILARDLGVTLHTIAIGRAGGIVRGTDPATDLPVMAEVEGPNLPLLERLAAITGGRSFVATDADALEDVFQTIDELEKSPVKGEILTRYDEHSPPGPRSPWPCSRSTGCSSRGRFEGCRESDASYLSPRPRDHFNR